MIRNRTQTVDFLKTLNERGMSPVVDISGRLPASQAEPGTQLRKVEEGTYSLNQSPRTDASIRNSERYCIYFRNILLKNTFEIQMKKPFTDHQIFNSRQCFVTTESGLRDCREVLSEGKSSASNQQR